MEYLELQTQAAAAAVLDGVLKLPAQEVQVWLLFDT
jgi:hypothetical protein